MREKRFVAVVAAIVLLHATCLAQTPRRGDDESSAAKPATPKVAGPGAAKPRQTSESSWEVTLNVAIPPGQAINLDSGIDFSYSDTVRVTVRSANGDLANLVLTAYWSLPQASLYNVGSVVTGDTFYYNNSGGAVFDTYGNQFRLRLTNNGSAAMLLTQVTVYAHQY